MKKLISILAVFSMLFCCSVMSCSFAQETAKKENSFTMGAKSQTESKKAKDLSKAIKGASIAAIGALGAVGTSIAAKNNYNEGYNESYNQGYNQSYNQSYEQGFTEGSKYNAKDIATNVVEGAGLLAVLAGTLAGIWYTGKGIVYGAVASWHGAVAGYNGLYNFFNTSFGQAADGRFWANVWHNTQYAFGCLFSRSTKLFRAILSIDGVNKEQAIAAFNAILGAGNLANKAASDTVIDNLAGGGQPLNGLAPAVLTAIKNAVALFFHLQ